MADLELDELRREFLEEAQVKVREIGDAIDRAAADSASLDRLAYLAHQLKGSGGSYGYAKISTAAADIEAAAEEMANKTAHDGTQKRLRDAVSTLRGEIDRSLSALASRG